MDVLSCLNIRGSCFLVFHLTHGRPPLFSRNRRLRCSFPNFAYEIKSHLRGTISGPSHLLPVLPPPTIIEILLRVPSTSIWASNDFLRLAKFWQAFCSPLKKKEHFYHQEKGGEDEPGKEREGSQKANISVTPFRTQQGKFLYYNEFWLIWSQLESYYKDVNERCWTWSRTTNPPWFLMKQ